MYRTQLLGDVLAADAAVAKREHDKDAYTKLWKEFGKALKMGVVEDAANRYANATLWQKAPNSLSVDTMPL